MTVDVQFEQRLRRLGESLPKSDRFVGEVMRRLEREPAQTEANGDIAGCSDNAQHWNRGPDLDFIENQVWSVGRDEC